MNLTYTGAFGPVQTKGAIYVPSSQYDTWTYLLQVIAKNSGLSLVTGAEASGKTTLGLWMYKSLSPLTHEAIFVPGITTGANAVLRPIARLFGYQGHAGSEELSLVTRGLDELAEEQRGLVIFVDCNNNVPPSDLWQQVDVLLQMQSMIGTQLTFVILGPETIHQSLANYPALKSRLLISHKLQALTEEETYQYLCHRMAHNCNNPPTLSLPVAQEIHHAAKGNFYRLNAIAEHAVLHTTAKSRNVIELHDVLVAVALVDGEPLAQVMSQPEADTPPATEKAAEPTTKVDVTANHPDQWEAKKASQPPSPLPIMASGSEAAAAATKKTRSSQQQRTQGSAAAKGTGEHRDNKKTDKLSSPSEASVVKDHLGKEEPISLIKLLKKKNAS